MLGGVLAQPTNVGDWSTFRLGFVPEFALNLGYNLTKNMTAFIGYDVIYLSSVSRPSTALDFNVNSGQIPFVTTPRGTAPPPAFTYSAEYFWVQGLNIGLNFAY
jgi:hypothetical protein